MTAVSALLLVVISGWLVPAPRRAMAAFLGPWLAVLIYQTVDIGLWLRRQPAADGDAVSAVNRVRSGDRGHPGARAGLVRAHRQAALPRCPRCCPENRAGSGDGTANLVYLSSVFSSRLAMPSDLICRSDAAECVAS